jgi:hypothetical protein
MESLLPKMRGLNYLDSENDKVMGRLEWLNHLSLVFNITANLPLISPSSSSITTEAFLNSLIESVSHFPLCPAASFTSTSSVKYLSFKEVFSLFEKDLGKILSWDHIMDKIVTFERTMPGHRRGEKSDAPGSIDLNELVYISKIGSLSVDFDSEGEHRVQKLGDLRIPQTPPGLETHSFQMLAGNFTPSPQESLEFGSLRASLRVPEMGNEGRSIRITTEKPTAMNLSCKKLTVLTCKLPNSLIELNLSHNRISRMPNLEDVDKLEYLNLSWNLITNLAGSRGMRTVRELYLAHNRVEEASSLAVCENLVILDLSYNKIMHFQGIAGLAEVQTLKVLDIEGNGVAKQIGLKESLSATIPQVVELNSKNIHKFSKFLQAKTTLSSSKALKSSAKTSNFISIKPKK